MNIDDVQRREQNLPLPWKREVLLFVMEEIGRPHLNSAKLIMRARQPINKLEGRWLSWIGLIQPAGRNYSDATLIGSLTQYPASWTRTALL